MDSFLEQFYIDKTLHKLMLHCIFFEFFWNREDSILSIKYINSLSFFFSRLESLDLEEGRLYFCNVWRGVRTLSNPPRRPSGVQQSVQLVRPGREFRHQIKHSWWIYIISPNFLTLNTERSSLSNVLEHLPPNKKKAQSSNSYLEQGRNL